MNPLDVIFERESPPAKLKIYAPNGDTKETVAYLGIQAHQKHSQLAELVLQHEDGTVEVLNKKVVVKNLETGQVCYNPRTAPLYFSNQVFISGAEAHWLQTNPHWPAILELWDNPMDGEVVEGLNP